jgi:hypothetical protein
MGERRTSCEREGPPPLSHRRVVAGVYWRNEVTGEEEEVQEVATRTRPNSKRNRMEEQMLAAKHLWSCMVH